MYWLVNNLFPTCVGINKFLTIMLLAVTTSCDGGALLTTQGTHICLILSFILPSGRVASQGGWPVQILDPNQVQKLLGVWRGGEGG